MVPLALRDVGWNFNKGKERVTILIHGLLRVTINAGVAAIKNVPNPTPDVGPRTGRPATVSEALLEGI